MEDMMSAWNPHIESVQADVPPPVQTMTGDRAFAIARAYRRASMRQNRADENFRVFLSERRQKRLDAAVARA